MMRPIELAPGRWLVGYGPEPFFYPETISLERVPTVPDPAAAMGAIVLGVILLWVWARIECRPRAYDPQREPMSLSSPNPKQRPRRRAGPGARHYRLRRA